MKQKPNLPFWSLWNLSFGFFGVQIAYALQSANISRIFATLGADPHNLSYFWILPPLMGILVQPIVGTLSDKTWTRFGRRIPYLFIGATVAVLVMCLLPNAGSLGLTVGAAMLFGLIALMFLDTSINMAMQPFKMLVGAMRNRRPKPIPSSRSSAMLVRWQATCSHLSLPSLALAMWQRRVWFPIASSGRSISVLPF